MIAAFLKKTFDSKQINLVKPLQIYIRDAYGKDKEKEKMSTIREIQQYRDSCNVDDQSVSPTQSIPNYEKYICYIFMLEKRFSFGRSGRGVFSKASKVEVNFKWADSYRPTKIEQNMDIKLEKFALIFNLGALYSNQAVKLSEQDDEGLKAACKLFRQAAGVFEWLSQNASSDSVAFVQNMDIQKDSCRFLSALMLAQAQACFTDMAIKLKKTKVGRTLAIGTADYFNDCVTLIGQTAALKSWIDKGQYDFRQHCVSQQQYYTAIGHYYEGVRVATLNEDGVYGKEIAWLKSAQSLLNGIGSGKAKLIPTLVSNKKALLKKLSPRLKEATKDNNDIYHDPIPNISNLKAIAGRQTVSVIAYKPKMDAVTDPFSTLVPKDVQKKADSLRAELLADVKALGLQCNENNDNARAILASLGLPAAVDCIDVEFGLPDSVWERINQCKEFGGDKELNTMYSRVESINQESWKILQDEIIAVLDIEQSVDTQIRTKLGGKWQRTASAELQKEYRTQIGTIANHLTTAIETNSKIEKSLKEHGAKFMEFNKSRDELGAQLPSVGAVKDNEEAEQLKSFLDELSKIIDERDGLKGDYEKEVEGLDVSQLFMQNQEASLETVTNLAKAPLFEINKKIDAGIKNQTECLEKISTQNELFVATKQNNPSQAKREQMIHVLNETVVKFKDAERHLKEGLKFYSDLMADYILPLKDEVDNFCASRQMERDLLLADLGENVQRLQINTKQVVQPSSQPQAPKQEEQKQPPPQQQKPPQQSYHQAPQHQPQQGYNPYYSQQPPPQQQQQPPPQYGQPPQQGYQQPPPQQHYQQPPPQYGGYHQQPPPQQHYQQPYGQPPQQGYQQPNYPPQQQHGGYQQPPPQQYQQQYPPQYNPNYRPPPNNGSNPSAPPP